MIHCPECRAENRDRALFCRSCGARMRRSSPRNLSERAPAERPEIPPTAPAADRRIRGWMASFDFDRNGESFVLRQGDNAVGRDPRAASVYLAADTRVSRRHCLIHADEGAVTVQDQGSEHGTFLNGERLGTTPAPLSDGDRLRVGGYTLQVKLL